MAGKDWEAAGAPPPGGPASHFQYRRVPRDRLWAFLFVLMWVACVVGGVYAIKHRNPAFLHLDYNDPASCPYEPNEAHRGLLEALAKEHGEDWSLSAFMRLTGRWLAVSALAALGLGLAFVHLFKHHAATMTRVTIATQIAFPLVAGMASLAAGQFGGALLFGALTALTVFVFGLWRNEIGLATRLLGVSAHGLVANGGIITATILLNLAAMVAITPLGLFLAFGFMNGSPAPNPSREGAAQCATPEGQEVLCCVWRPNEFGQAYMGLASVGVLWTMLLANQIRVFVTSGAIAQWYFASPGLSAPRGTVSVSLKHALGPQFGSLCLSSLVLMVSEMMRSALENAQQNDRDMNFFKLMCICLAQCFWSLVEYLTKFATVMMAITGETFLSAGRHVTDLLARNFLTAFASTIWFTPLVIRMAVFVLSAAWALLSGGTYYVLHRGSDLEANPQLNAAVLGGAVFLVTAFVLSFLGGVLLSVLDAVFVCWAIDRDSQTVSHPEVYAVLASVPLPGAVVENPDGGIAYGAGQRGAEGAHAYQPPGVTHV